MPDISDKLFKKIGQKFPVMNVILGVEGEDYKGTTQIREIAGYNVTLIIGISNVYVTEVTKIDD